MPAAHDVLCNSPGVGNFEIARQVNPKNDCDYAVAETFRIAPSSVWFRKKKP